MIPIVWIVIHTLTQDKDGNTERFTPTPLQRKILEYAAKHPQPRGYVTKTGAMFMIRDEAEFEQWWKTFRREQARALKDPDFPEKHGEQFFSTAVLRKMEKDAKNKGDH